MKGVNRHERLNFLRLFLIGKDSSPTLAYLNHTVVIYAVLTTHQQWHAVDVNRSLALVRYEKVAVASKFYGALLPRHFVRGAF